MKCESTLGKAVMQHLVLSVVFAMSLAPLSQAETATALSADSLEIVAGDDWTGTLTYLNYGEPLRDFTIPAELQVEVIERGLRLNYKYPEEPKENSSVTARISADGTKLMGAPIVANRVLDAGEREVITRYPCNDMGQTATCETILTLSQNEFRSRKMVTYEGESDAFRRNEYVFTR